MYLYYVRYYGIATYAYVEVPIKRILYNEFVLILRSALPALASSNLEALPLVGWAPRSAANGPLRVPSSRESKRNESECASLKRIKGTRGLSTRIPTQHIVPCMATLPPSLPHAMALSDRSYSSPKA